MSEWWVGRRGADPVGPVSTETLVRGVKEKKVPPNALVCRVGEQQWHHVAQVDELWDRINPDGARTTVTEKPWFGAVAESSPPADSLADADDGDEAATRIYDSRTMSSASDTARTEATESPTVPLVTASTSGGPGVASGTESSPTSADTAAGAPHPIISKPAPAKAAAPAFRPPASLVPKTAQAGDIAKPATGNGGVQEIARTPKAVIPAPRFGVDRAVPASPIAAGAFISKPPSVRPGPIKAEAGSSAVPDGQSSPSGAKQSAPPSTRQSSPPSARQSSSPPPRENAATAARQTLAALASRQTAATAPRQSAAPRASAAGSGREGATVPVKRQSSSAGAGPAGLQATRQSTPPGSARVASADKSRQPIPPVPVAVIPLPQDSELASLVRNNADISLTETRPDRPDRRVSKDAEASQKKPVTRSGTLANRDAVVPRPVTVPRAEPKQSAPRPTATMTPHEAMPRIEARRIVAVADSDDEDATVIRDVQKEPPQPLLAEDDEDATVVRQQVVSSPPSADDDETVIIRHQAALPPAEDDETVVKQAFPHPAVTPSENLQRAPHATAPPPRELERLATPPVDGHSGKHRSSTDAEPLEAAPTQQHPAQPVGQQTTPAAVPPAPPEPEAHDLFDEDDEPLPARARNYAGAHDPPSSSENGRPRPAAGTPPPPSVIVAQHHVPMDPLGRVIQPHADLTRPALRTIRPPGTIQISIATLIVGAMSLVVIVLTAVLLLR